MRAALLTGLLTLAAQGCIYDMSRARPGDGSPRREQSADRPIASDGTRDAPGDSPQPAPDALVDARRVEDTRPQDGAKASDGKPADKKADTKPKTDTRPDTKPAIDAAKADKPKTDTKPAVDAPKGDTKPGPLVTWKSAAAQDVSCYPQVLMGGGSKCTGGEMTDSWAAAGAGSQFTTYCSSGSPTSWGACANSLGSLLTYGWGAGMSWNCAGSEYLVGGGCNCTTPGVVVSSYPDYAYQTWRCACTSGLGDTSAMCLPKTALASRRVVSNGNCAADEQLVGGGCDCGTSTFHLLESVPDVTNKGWICTCSGGGTAGRYAICVK